MNELISSNFNSLRSILYNSSRHILGQSQRNQIKKWLLSRRKKWARLSTLVYGKYGAQDLINHIRTRIADDFDVLMVHSAYDRLLPAYSGTPNEMINELLTFCGKDRTLVMPTFVLGSGRHSSCEYYRKRHFDVKRTPSQMGLLTEIFRRMPGVRRSMHPTHSVCAIGPLSERLTSEHHLAPTASGKGTPFALMAQKRTAIVGLGIEYYRCLTQVHTAEHLLGADFPVRFHKEWSPVTIVDANGGHLVYDLTVFKSDSTFDASVLRSLLSRVDLQEWSYKGTPLFVTFADKVTDCLIAAARKGITVYGHYKAQSLQHKTQSYAR